MATGNDLGFENEVLGQLSAGTALSTMAQTGISAQRTGNQFVTAVRVQVARDLQVKHKQLLTEARLAGESFYYGWGVGKDRVLGPSIGLAMAAARVWGNCAVDFAPVQSTEDSWIFTAQFIDLETGFTLARQFRQSKHWSVAGKYDQERKDDMRFQIGQSKAARNVVVNALPKWLIDAAIREAQNGVRGRIEKYVEQNGLPAAVDICIKQLKQCGVSEAAVLAKCQVAAVTALDIEHVVMLRGDLYSLQNGMDRAEALFPEPGSDARTVRGDVAQGGGAAASANTPTRSAVDASLASETEGQERQVVSEAAKVAAQQADGAAPRKRPAAKATAQPPTTPADAPAQQPAAPASAVDSRRAQEDQLATAPAQSPPESPATNGGASDDSQPAVDLPAGFRARLKACKSSAQIDGLMHEFDVEATLDVQWQVMVKMADERRAVLREETRRAAGA